MRFQQDLKGPDAIDSDPDPTHSQRLHRLCVGVTAAIDVDEHPWCDKMEMALGVEVTGIPFLQPLPDRLRQGVTANKWLG